MSIVKRLRERTEPLTVKEIAEIFRVTEETVQRWARKREIPAFRVVREIRFDPASLADWIDLQSIARQRNQDEPSEPV
jgi:excisionase family DNA binding protein